jgi:hypothetical protein
MMNEIKFLRILKNISQQSFLLILGSFWLPLGVSADPYAVKLPKNKLHHLSTSSNLALTKYSGLPYLSEIGKDLGSFDPNELHKDSLLGSESKLSWRLERDLKAHEVKINTWQLYLGKHKIWNHQLTITSFQNKIQSVESIGHHPDQLHSWIEDLSTELQELIHSTPTSIWFATEQSLQPASVELQRDPDNHELYRIIKSIDGQQILDKESLSFQFTARVMTELSIDDYKIEDVELSDILQQPTDGAAKLMGRVFQVSSPVEDIPVSQSNRFDYDPTQQSSMFNQVQVYFNLTEIKEWFKDTFSFDDDYKLEVVVDTLVYGEAQNAAYEPSVDSNRGSLLFGSGGSSLTNLSRDFDIASHEFSHHVIWQTINSKRGDALIIHEGYADYFTYAATDDPYLGESSALYRDYIRSAVAPRSIRYDDPLLSPHSHDRGEVLSALLWELRLEIGSSFDQVVYRSLAYLNGYSELSDVMLGLIQADRDLNPIAVSETYYGLHGTNKCSLIQSMIERGFVGHLTDINPEGCDLTLPTENHNNEQPVQHSMTSNGTSSKKPFCGTLTGDSQKQNLGLWAILCTLSLPMLFGLYPILKETNKALKHCSQQNQGA